MYNNFYLPNRNINLPGEKSQVVLHWTFVTGEPHLVINLSEQDLLLLLCSAFYSLRCAIAYFSTVNYICAHSTIKMILSDWAASMKPLLARQSFALVLGRSDHGFGYPYLYSLYTCTVVEPKTRVNPSSMKGDNTSMTRGSF